MGECLSEVIRYSRGANKHDNTPAQLEADDFAQFCDAVIADQAKAKGLQWIAAPCGVAPDDARHRGSESMAAAIGKPHRCGECVGPRRWLGLDVDEIPGEEAFHALLAILRPYSGLVWTTHSHTAAAPRCRVLLELDVPGDRAQIIAASQAIRARIDGQLKLAEYAVGWDSACDRPEQPLYLPPVDSEFELLQGDPLCLGELVDAAAKPKTPEAVTLPAGIVEGDAWAAAALQRAAQAVAAAQPGDRNKILNREAYGLGGFVGAGRLNRERVTAALDAATAGWDNPAKTRGTIRGGIAAGAAKPRPDGLPAPQVASLHPVSLAGVMDEDDEEWPHVVACYFPRRVVTLLGGHGGVGKSMLALILAAHVAAGRPWGPLAVERGRVVFLSFEDEAQVLRQRLRRIVRAYALPPDEVFANLALFDGSDAETELALETAGGGLEFTPMMSLVAEAVRGAALAIVDNASDTYGASEVERRQVRRFVRRLAQEGKANNGAVVLLAHVDKQAAKGAGKGNNYSGSTQWHNSVRSRLALMESDEAGIELVHEKANYGAMHEPITLQRGEWGVLAPIPAEAARASREAAAAVMTQGDKAALLQVFEALIAHEITIPTAETGSRTTYHVLSRAPEFPAHLKGSGHKERVKAAVQALERDGRIAREAFRKPDRKAGERWTLPHLPPREGV